MESKLERKQTHRAETRRQIILPAILIFAALIGFVVLLVFLSKDHPVGVRKAANYSLAVILFFLMLISYALTIGLIKLITLVQEWRGMIPESTGTVIEKIQEIEKSIVDVLNKTTDPFITTESKFKAVKNTFFKKKETEG